MKRARLYAIARERALEITDATLTAANLHGWSEEELHLFLTAYKRRYAAARWPSDKQEAEEAATWLADRRQAGRLVGRHLRRLCRDRCATSALLSRGERMRAAGATETEIALDRARHDVAHYQRLTKYLGWINNELETAEGEWREEILDRLAIWTEDAADALPGYRLGLALIHQHQPVDEPVLELAGAA